MTIYNVREMICCEDKDILVCSKPAGLPVQSASPMKTDLESLLKNYVMERSAGKSSYIGVVQRLDQPVEGLLVFGKNSKAAGALHQQSEEGRLQKTYLAVVCGQPQPERGRLMDYLKKDGRSRISTVVSPQTAGAKKAVLDYCVLERQREFSLVEIKLQTGRFHQIRVQMAHGGWPLAGDRKYGKGDGAGCVALCAYKLSFAHPISGETMNFQIVPSGEIFHRFRFFQE